MVPSLLGSALISFVGRYLDFKLTGFSKGFRSSISVNKVYALILRQHSKLLPITTWQWPANGSMHKDLRSPLKLQLRELIYFDGQPFLAQLVASQSWSARTALPSAEDFNKKTCFFHVMYFGQQ